jgi:hypothetical protein
MGKLNGQRRRLLLPGAALVAGFVVSAGLPVWINHSGANDKASHWQKAVYRFDTGVLFSCETFAREIAQLPSPSVGTPAEDQWERIPPNPPLVNGLPDCLLQAGLMAL